MSGRDMRGTRQWSAYERLQAWFVAGMNKRLKVEVAEARAALGIPAEGFPTEKDADDWEKARKTESEATAAEQLHLGSESVRRLFHAMLAGAWLDSRVPTDRKVLELVERFHLPPWGAFWVRRSLLLGDKASPETWPTPRTAGEWDRLMGPMLQSESLPDLSERGTYYVAGHPYPRAAVPLNPEGRYWAVVVVGVSESTTTDEWLGLWNNIRPWIQEGSPIKPSNRRLANDFATLKRGLLWWKWIEEEWLTYDQALRRHGDQTGKTPDESQMKRAVRRVRELMEPSEVSPPAGPVQRPVHVVFAPGARLAGMPHSIPPGAPPIKASKEAAILRHRPSAPPGTAHGQAR